MRAQGATTDVVVAVVGRPWGTKGQFLLDPRGNDPASLLERRSLRLRMGGRPASEHRILASHLAGGRLVVQVEGCGSIEAAEALRGAEAVVAADDLDPAPAGSFYIHELIGLDVVLASGDAVGVVEDVLRSAGPEVLIVRSGAKEILIPFAESICRRIDLAHGRIEVDPPEGLLELDR